MTASIEEGVLVSVVGAVIIGEAGVGKPKKSNLGRLVDEGANFNAPTKNIKSSLLAMMSLKSVGKRNGQPLRVPMKGKS